MTIAKNKIEELLSTPLPGGKSATMFYKAFFAILEGTQTPNQMQYAIRYSKMVASGKSIFPFGK